MYIDISEAIATIKSTIQSNHESREPQSLYAPRNYIMDMDGKKMRALMVLFGYGLYRDDYSTALELAFCAELFHNFTLVHDDLMDAAELRRGQSAVHIKYDSSTAILSGDMMLIEVYDRLATGTEPMRFIPLFNKMAREVCEGQAMDMDFEKREDVSIAEYLRMIELKTAVLVGMSLQVGALLGGASENEAYHLYHFGVNAGIAFQLQDDYLDVYGDPEKFGKKVGGDIIQGKKTYLYLRTMDLLEGTERKSFHDLYMSVDMPDANKVEAVRQIFSDLYIKNYCAEAQQSYMDLANSHIEMLKDPEEQRISDLRTFIKSLIDRQK